MGCVHVSRIPETCYMGGVEEGSYRQSRLCRLLGNPVAFAVVQLQKFFLLTPTASRLMPNAFLGGPRLQVQSKRREE